MSGTVFRTVAELEGLIGDEINRRIDFLVACQQMIEALYATGKLPGSCFELTVGTSEVFVPDNDGNVKIQVDAADNDGALAFRTVCKGYTVRDLAQLYKETPAGFKGFIDLGYNQVEVDGVPVYRREYRVPVELRTTDQTIYGYMKKRPPILDRDCEFPVRSLHAVKNGLIAVGLESDGDSQGAGEFWKTVYGELRADTSEYDGIKKRTLTFKGMTKRRPHNHA